MPIHERTRDMTIRVYTVHPDGSTTELVPRHVAARSTLRYLQERVEAAVIRVGTRDGEVSPPSGPTGT